jgi:DNA-binding transcriptional LysR family regulator
MDGERSPVPWDDIRIFLAAARAGGMSAAARGLAIRQSTVSRRVAALERRLGAAVFDRTAVGLVLTALGRRVLAAAGDAEGALRRVTDAPLAEERAVAGRVRLALTETMASLLVLPRVLPALLARHPALAVDLVTGDTAADLARREADVAIRFFLTPRGDLLTRRVATLPTAPVARRELARALVRLPPPRWPRSGGWTGGSGTRHA